MPILDALGNYKHVKYFTKFFIIYIRQLRIYHSESLKQTLVGEPYHQWCPTKMHAPLLTARPTGIGSPIGWPIPKQRGSGRTNFLGVMLSGRNYHC